MTGWKKDISWRLQKNMTEILQSSSLILGKILFLPAVINYMLINHVIRLFFSPLSLSQPIKTMETREGINGWI